MHGKTNERALELISKLMQWELCGRLEWDADRSKLEWDSSDRAVVWNVQPSRGGPVSIVHRTFDLDGRSVEELRDIADALIDLGEDIEAHSQEHADFEEEIRSAAKSLLRRKAARGLRLVSVLCQPIPTDYYQNIGVDVTIGYDRGGENGRETFSVWSVDELKEEFENLLKQLDECSAMAA